MNPAYFYLAGSGILIGVTLTATIRAKYLGEPWHDHFAFLLASVCFAAGGLWTLMQ